MKTIKFNTFANTPEEVSALNSKLHTQQSLAPNHQDKYKCYDFSMSNLTELKRQMQEALNSRRKVDQSQTKKHNRL